MFDYPINVGDRVKHVRDESWEGIVVRIDTNLPYPTTCEVLWDDSDGIDIQWMNKLELLVNVRVD